MTQKAKRQKDTYRTRTQKGLCGLCGEPRNGSSTALCETCKAKQKERYKARRKQGRCFRCDRATVRPGSAYCEQHQAVRDERRQRRRDEGYCYECGKGHALAPGKRCPACWFKNIAKSLNGVSPDELRQLFDEQDGKCRLTGRPLVLGENAHLDHIVPRSRGGTDALSNLRWLDRQVNQAKNDMTDQEFVMLARQVIDTLA